MDAVQELCGKSWARLAPHRKAIMNSLSAPSSREPIRLFRSAWLEGLTHTHPAVVPVLWLPVATAFIALNWGRWAPAAILAGLALWTPAEYLLHRFVFHWRPRTPRQERFVFLIHGIHHAQPMVKTRLVMPPAAALPLAALFYLFFWSIIGRAAGAPPLVGPLFGGFLIGYVAYDLLHYAFHHAQLPGGYLRTLRRRHMRHHTAHTRLFGVTSPLWDRVFGTDLPITPRR
jgi:sterol desaturase/sphingolipid hydroxylase (fatty acid hydroxylase superfamily)